MFSNEMPALSANQDCYGAMLIAVKTWLAQHHPEAEYASIVVETGETYPVLQIPIFTDETVS